MGRSIAHERSGLDPHDTQTGTHPQPSDQISMALDHPHQDATGSVRRPIHYQDQLHTNRYASPNPSRC
jgi:hypothetical protein